MSPVINFAASLCHVKKVNEIIYKWVSKPILSDDSHILIPIFASKWEERVSELSA